MFYFIKVWEREKMWNVEQTMQELKLEREIICSRSDLWGRGAFCNVIIRLHWKFSKRSDWNQCWTKFRYSIYLKVSSNFPIHRHIRHWYSVFWAIFVHSSKVDWAKFSGWLLWRAQRQLLNSVNGTAILLSVALFSTINRSHRSHFECTARRWRASGFR